MSRNVKYKDDNGQVLYLNNIYLSTGLEDSNDKELFEGDVVRCHDGKVGEIIFEPEQGGFIVKGDYCKHQNYRRFNCDEACLSEHVGHSSQNLPLTGGCWVD
jgi:hypothetical protein